MNIALNSLKAIMALFVAPLAAWVAIKMGWTPEETKSFTENALTVLGWIFSIGLPTAISVWVVPNIKREKKPEGDSDA